MPRAKTGNKLGRPFEYTDDADRPVTLSLRVPRDLYNRMKAYRVIHYTSSVTDLLLEGLKSVLDDGADPFHPTSNGTQHYSNTVTKEEASPRQPAPQTALAGMNLTPDMLTTTDVENMPLAPENGSVISLDTADLDAIPLTPVALSPPPALDYDPTKYTLGKLCPRGHDYQGTGQSLRQRLGRTCIECKKAHTRTTRQAQRQAALVG